MKKGWGFPLLPAALPPFRAPRGLALCDVAAVTRHGLRTPTRDLPHDRTPWDEGVPGGVRGSVQPGAHELHVPANLLTRIRQLPVRSLSSRMATRRWLHGCTALVSFQDDFDAGIAASRVCPSHLSFVSLIFRSIGPM